MDKKTSITIDEEIWSMVEKLSDTNLWPQKAIVACAVYKFCTLSTDEQFTAYRDLRDFRIGLLEKRPKKGV